MDEKDRENLERVVLHCKMFQYGYNQTFSPALVALGIEDQTPNVYNQFAGLHLISTMFLIDKGDKPMGGFCYGILKSVGLEGLLSEIREIVESPVGNTSFGDYIRHIRNRLATHGDLSPDSLPPADKEVSFDYDAVQRFQDLLERLAEEVKTLESKLTGIMEEEASAE